MPEPILDRFLSRIEPGDPTACWEWGGSRYPSGYGRLGDLYAHRVSWSLANERPIPDGLVVMHTCDNPPCVNPAHLRIGTHADNARDRDEKGRHPVTAAPGMPADHLRTVPDQTIAAIRALRAEGFSTREVARRTGVSGGTVYYYTVGPRADYEVLA